MIQFFFRCCITLSFLAGLCGCGSNAHSPGSMTDAMENEVIYHVVQRSFYDSNGDMHGDLNGIRQKLDYLQELGITSILLLPLYQSVYYHNYFASDFEKIDSTFGTMQDYLNLVKEIHKRGMKIYMDMETQYVTEDHLWYKDSWKNPVSAYGDYILYKDSAHLYPETIIFDLTELKGYDGATRKITTVNLQSEKVKEYNYKLFKYWVDPNGDGKFDDGVDGFRLDHMMNDLDGKKQLTGLFRSFWLPLLTKLKQINPQLQNVAEQADWNSYGMNYLEKGGVDRVFAFRLMAAIRKFNKKEIAAAADTIFGMTPVNKQQVVFLENHDMARFSNQMKYDRGKMQVGAALNLLIGGIPAIYYGQELGMRGAGGFNKYGVTDANDIPQREAFEWYRSDTGKGMATWYRNTGPWWDSTNLKPGDGISLEEERIDPNSLWNFYKQLLGLRKANSRVFTCKYVPLKNDNDSVFSFLRYGKDEGIIVTVNLSSGSQNVNIDVDKDKIIINKTQLLQLLGNEKPVLSFNHMSVSLPAYAIEVWKVK